MYHQTGGGGLRFYTAPAVIQRGRGLGGILGRLFRTIIPLARQPIVRKTLKRLGRAAIDSSASALKEKLDRPSDTSFRTSLKRNLEKNLTRPRRPKKRQTIKKRPLDILDFK